MTKIAFECDRCGKPVEGLHLRSGTSGFYVVDDGTPWAKYRQERPEGFAGNDEHFVCDECIQSMPEYQAAYGPQVSEKGKQ